MAYQDDVYTLFEKYLAGNCSAQEIQALVELFGQPSEEATLRQLIREALDAHSNDALMQDRVDAFTSRVGEKLTKAIQTPPQEDTPVRFLYPKRFMAIAASLLLLCVVGIGFYYAWQREEATVPLLSSEFGADVLPGGNRATLTLANGNVILLDEGKQGIVTGDSITYDDGTSLSVGSQPTEYHVLSTPKGGQYMVTLPDGSNVWLNAASSLRYPTKFAGKERIVELDGEAYFEVKRNEKQPFVVKSGHQEVQVLGTEFNVNAYSDEPLTTTTLVDGAIQVVNLTSNIVNQLQPGKQSAVQDGNTTITNVDVSSFVNWKRGLFSFRETEMRDAMNQLSRWYDVEVVYEKPIPPTHFFGDIKRDNSLAQVLNILKKSGVNFRIERGEDNGHNKLVVLP